MFDVNAFEGYKDLSIFNWFYDIIQISKAININDSSGHNSFSLSQSNTAMHIYGSSLFKWQFFILKENGATILIGSFVLMSFCLALKEFPRV